MSYSVELDDQGQSDLDRLSVDLIVAVEAGLERLAADPVGQTYQFVVELADGRHLLVIFFRYGSDEQTLHVHGISHMPLG